MRHILVAAAAIAACGFLGSVPASAQYAPGGPDRVGGMCKVSTDGFGNDTYGYYAPCPSPPAYAAAGGAAYAQAPRGGYEPGGPAVGGGGCKVSTDGFGNDTYGYMGPCAAPPVAAARGAAETAYARAPSGGYEPGGPAVGAGGCKVSTDGFGNDTYGYMGACQ